ncbi:SRPBCC family protein [Streptomyces alfalfae]|uniref:Polyketide cyclase n=1 Tax=Streptomyces alfalfae TaxID=1642299 RepID=A0A1P8TQ59_9ACTN|nr:MULTISPECIES: SRPBCC family protein [Streptomyces]AYA20231.1 SRPBCC family protein [Streptomyces fradiae]APY89779.1 polyketide cyclase [Streptomyces alfalfae]KUL54123.1 polyketide cyclase [Streptomyces sp. NRRL S-1521]QQC87738.1 SRPBCC family protein [Streptomyces alfalfae]QUI30167.1 SRPBCC family protein [Streptomyces alfalfae]
MARTFSVSRSIVVEAPPSLVYEQVGRPAQMGRWSPENLGATLADADGPARVGQVFVGHNKRGAVRWTTRCTVTRADPGACFAFRVHAIGLKRPRLRGPIATWEYRFEAATSAQGVPGGATRVTETWTDDRRSWPDAVANAFDRIATRGHTFAAFQTGNIDRTLRNLKRELDGTAPEKR